jgi:hypothetical protein
LFEAAARKRNGRSRVLPLGDWHEKDDMENRCGGDIVATRPRCLNMITTTAEVIRRIEMYFWGGAI